MLVFRGGARPASRAIAASEDGPRGTRGVRCSDHEPARARAAVYDAFARPSRRRLLLDVALCLERSRHRRRHGRRLFLLREERHLAPAVLGRAHRAVALEDDAFLDDEAGRGDVAIDAAGSADLEPLRSVDVAGDLAVDDDRAAGDLRVQDGRLADEERVASGHLALDLSLDASRSLEDDLSGDASSASEERARL